MPPAKALNLSNGSKILLCSTPKKSRRITRDQIKQYCRMMVYGRSVGKSAAIGYAVHTCIDEAHVVVTRDDYNAADGDIKDIYEQLARHISGDSPAQLGYPLAPVSACGNCPRSMGCLRGRTPAIICPRCRRTNHGHSKVLDAVYRSEREDYELVHAHGNRTVEKHDYVPTSCPLWLEGAPMVAKEPCDLCKEKPKVVAVCTVAALPYHRHRQELLFRIRRSPDQPLSKNPLSDYMRSKQPKRKGKHASSHQQALQRPSGRTPKRAPQQRQPCHHRR